jgi:hypothetical protein
MAAGGHTFGGLGVEQVSTRSLLGGLAICNLEMWEMQGGADLAVPL